MMRPTTLVTSLVGLTLATAAALATGAPADAATFVGPLNNNHVEYKLSHADTVQLYNDPNAIYSFCWTFWQGLQVNGVYFPAVTWSGCTIDVMNCVRQAVGWGAAATDVTWTWAIPAPAASCTNVF